MMSRCNEQSRQGGTTTLVRAFLLIGAMQFIPHSVAASDGVEEQSSRSFVEVSGLLCVQPEGPVDNHYLDGPLGGTSPGLAGAVGHIFENRMIIEGGVKLRTAIAADQNSAIGGFTTFTTSHRETASDLLAGYDVE